MRSVRRKDPRRPSARPAAKARSRSRQIGAGTQTHLSVLETEWQHVASPARIQKLAESRLGMGDTASAQLSSFDLLPRRGDEAAPLNSTPVHNASAQVPAAPAPIRPTSHSGL